MSEQIPQSYKKVGPFKCPYTDCYDTDYHAHSERAWITAVEHLRKELAEAKMILNAGADGLTETSKALQAAEARAEKAEKELADCERHENCYGPEPIRALDAENAALRKAGQALIDAWFTAKPMTRELFDALSEAMKLTPPPSSGKPCEPKGDR